MKDEPLRTPAPSARRNSTVAVEGSPPPTPPLDRRGRRYEAEGRARKTIPAQQLWFAVLDSQVETGTPYMLYKDACNGKSNQKHLGTIKSSNLCTEIVEYTSPDEVAVCNLASINLTAMVVNGEFDFAKLRRISGVVTKNLNKVIDVNYYPIPEAENSNMRHRPIGIGVQGLADALVKLRLPYESPEARALNKDIFETIYYGAMEASIQLAKEHGTYATHARRRPKSPPRADSRPRRRRDSSPRKSRGADSSPRKSRGADSPPRKSRGADSPPRNRRGAAADSRETKPVSADSRGVFLGGRDARRPRRRRTERRRYAGSPTSEGKLQPDLWGVTPSDRWDWRQLRADLAEHGCRNSLLLAPMPTASTAQILGNNESFEPFTSNMFTRRVLAGEFAVVNKYLLQDLIARGLWTPEVRNQIIADKGSVQQVAAIPEDLKSLYKTTWEIKQKCVLDMSADRGAFICQSQSLNLHIADPSPGKLTSMHFYAWKKGLKTGMYYLRTRPKADAIAFTVDQAMAAKSRGDGALKPANKGTPEPEECLSCGA